jgi:hypothetical protein
MTGIGLLFVLAGLLILPTQGAGADYLLWHVLRSWRLQLALGRLPVGHIVFRSGGLDLSS